MTATAELKKPERKEMVWTKEEKDNLKSKYGTEILVEDGSLEDVNIKQAPTDAYIIKYVHDDQVRYDLTRGTKIKLFDMYNNFECYLLTYYIFLNFFSLFCWMIFHFPQTPTFFRNFVSARKGGIPRFGAKTAPFSQRNQTSNKHALTLS